MYTNDTTIHINHNWSGGDDATRIVWVSDDRQGEIDGGVIDQSRGVEGQMIEFARELVANGHDGTGEIRLA